MTRRLPLYLGGFMGPFGTVVILPMFPELRTSFDASREAVGWGFTVYLLPFAALLIVSGTLGERWGRRRTVRTTFVVYAAASLVCAVAPTLAVFLAGRALQGVANAFITPLLLAGLADLTPEAELGRRVGIYSSFQSFGSALAPLVGGLAADTNWRWAFVGTAAVAIVLSMFPPDGEPRRDVARPPVRPLLSRRMVLLGVVAFTAAAGPIGASVLVGVAARDELDLSGGEAGVILLLGSAAAMVLGPVWGRALDAWGPRTAGVGSVTVVSLVVLAMGWSSAPWSLGFLWLVAGAVTAFVVVVLQATAAKAVPQNRGGAVSSMLAYRFLGHALGPVVWLPLFGVSPRAAFAGSAALGAVSVIAFIGATAPARGADVSATPAPGLAEPRHSLE